MPVCIPLTTKHSDLVFCQSGYLRPVLRKATLHHNFDFLQLSASEDGFRAAAPRARAPRPHPTPIRRCGTPRPPCLRPTPTPTRLRSPSAPRTCTRRTCARPISRARPHTPEAPRGRGEEGGYRTPAAPHLMRLPRQAPRPPHASASRPLQASGSPAIPAPRTDAQARHSAPDGGFRTHSPRRIAQVTSRSRKRVKMTIPVSIRHEPRTNAKEHPP